MKGSRSQVVEERIGVIPNSGWEAGITAVEREVVCWWRDADGMLFGESPSERLQARVTAGARASSLSTR